MMSKAELARKAGLSTLTIDRVEAGRPCRLDTKRKILLALGLRVTDKDRIFGQQPDEPAGGSPQPHSSESFALPAGGSHAQESIVTMVNAGRDTGNGEPTR
jgi:hypothetical protein